jgi:hypothetical protein
MKKLNQQVLKKPFQQVNIEIPEIPAARSVSRRSTPGTE